MDEELKTQKRNEHEKKKLKFTRKRKEETISRIKN